MALVTVKPTHPDRRLARFVSAHSSKPVERGSRALSWLGDERLLIAASALAHLATSHMDEDTQRLSRHFLMTSVVAAVLPHILKAAVNQERPDRETIVGHFRGVQFSGHAEDAFPSGHAVHAGAIASAATLLPRDLKRIIWAGTAAVAAARLLTLAHWLSDIVAGAALGIILERSVRRITMAETFNRA